MRMLVAFGGLLLATTPPLHVAVAQTAEQETAGRAEIAKFYMFLNERKLDDAAKMVIGDAHYGHLRDYQTGGSREVRTLAAKAFVAWMVECQPISPSMMGVDTPPLTDGRVGTFFNMTCPSREQGAPGVTVDIVFTVRSRGDGILIA